MTCTPGPTGGAAPEAADASLRRQLALLEEAEAAARVGSWAWDVAADDAFLSAEAWRLWRIEPRRPARLSSFTAKVHPDDQTRLRDLIVAAADLATATLLADLRLAEGTEVRVLRHRGSVLKRDAGGQVLRAAGIVEDVTEQVAAEAAQARTRAIVEQAQELARVGAWDYDPLDGSVTWSTQMYRLHGLPPGERPTVPVQDDSWYPEGDRERVVAAFVEALRSGAPFDLEVRLLAADGRTLWVRSVGRAQLEGGKVLRLFGHVMDVTERHIMEDLLRASEAQYRRLVEDSPLGIVRLAADGRFLAANGAAARIYGEPNVAALLSRGTADYCTDPEAREEMLRELQTGKTRNRQLLQRRDGTRFWVRSRAQVLRDADGQVVGSQAIFEDITPQVEAEEARAAAERARRETENRLAAIVESSHEAIFSKDLRGVIQTWNPAAERIYGWKAGEAIGRTVHELLVPADRHDEEERILEWVGQGKVFESPSVRRLRKDGGLVDVSWSSHPVRDEAGAVVGIAVVSQDLSARRRIEAEGRPRAPTSSPSWRTYPRASSRPPWAADPST